MKPLCREGFIHIHTHIHTFWVFVLQIHMQRELHKYPIYRGIHEAPIYSEFWKATRGFMNYYTTGALQSPYKEGLSKAHSIHGLHEFLSIYDICVSQSPSP